MSDAFWTMVGVVLPVFILQVFQFLAAQRNSRDSKAGREEIKAQVCEVKDHLATVSMQAVRSQEEIVMAHKAGEREGFVGGIEVGKRQATAPAELGDK